MGIELNSLKDMATVSMTAVELAAIDKIIATHINNREFISDYHSLIHDITNTYQVVLDNLQPLLEFDTEQQFIEGYDVASQAFLDCYLKQISVPRVNAELTYEKYLQFRKLKEVNTGFPVLKRTFARLHDYIDKWLDNDIWLAMTIDSLFKMTARLINELTELKARDAEDAFITYQSGLPGFQVYLGIITNSLQQIAARR